jgi:DNA polymerase-3 subunit beta
MKLTLERNVLLKALNLATSVVEKNNTIPILSNVMLTAFDGRLRLTSTNLDMELTLPVAAAVERKGTTTVPGYLLQDIVKKLPDGSQIDMDMGNDTRMTVKAGRSRFVVQTLPAEDFPTLGTFDSSVSFDMDAQAFKRLFSKTLFACSTEETRYYLNGVYLHKSGDKLAGVATDGHRLGKAWVDLPIPELTGVIVPRRTCQLIIKFLDAEKGAVKVEMSASKIAITWNEVSFISKLIDGSFPDYERVVPQGNQKIAEGDVKILAAAVDRAATVAAEKGRAGKFGFSREGLTITLASSNNDQAEEGVEMSYDSEPLDVGFNTRYVLDTLSNLECQKLRIEMGDGGMPAIFRPVDGDLDCFAIIMPVRV